MGDALARRFWMCWGHTQINVNATEMCVWDFDKRNAFEAVASGGAGDLLFTMNQI